MAGRFSKKNGFTQLQGTEARNTLASKLIGPADRIRDLKTKFGIRNYQVRIIRTRWSGRVRGRGKESIIYQQDILPTPKISDLGTMTEIATMHGLEEIGAIQVSEISGRFTEDLLLGIDPEGFQPLETDNVFYEVEFPRPDGRPGTRRRFGISAAPTYVPSRLQWFITLTKIEEDRARDGELR